MHPILHKLRGGDRRSIGRSNEVVADVLADSSLFDVVFSGLFSDDPLVRMRSADAVEKITAIHPEYLHPHKAKLIGPIAAIEQQEVRWHAAQMLPRLKLNDEERRQVVGLLLGYSNDRSSIVNTCAMQALAEIAMQAPELKPSILIHLRELTVIGTPAMKARGRKLLARLDRVDTSGRSTTHRVAMYQKYPGSFATEAEGSMTQSRNALFDQVALELGQRFDGEIRIGGKYVSIIEHKDEIYVSGQIPRVGNTVLVTGRVGAETSVDQGKLAAKICTMRALALLRQSVGDLERVKKILRITVYVQSAPDFTQQSEVADGASEVLYSIFSASGVHTRTSVGVLQLPKNAAVELDMIAVVEPAA